MIVHYTSVKCVFDHLSVYFVYATSNGFDETTASDDGIKFQRNA